MESGSLEKGALTHLPLVAVCITYRRKNSVRDKVIGRKWIYFENNTLHRQSGSRLRREWP